jgi:enoyl-CoA hydratase/carnithine racemase
MTSPDDGVRIRREGDAAYITIDRPAVRNAFDRTTWAALARAVAAAHASPARVVAIEGAGGVFSAGGDLNIIRMGCKAYDLEWAGR